MDSYETGTVYTVKIIRSRQVSLNRNQLHLSNIKFTEFYVDLVKIILSVNEYILKQNAKVTYKKNILHKLIMGEILGKFLLLKRKL